MLLNIAMNEWYLIRYFSLQMERFFKAKGIHPEFGGNLFSYCTDGPQLLRLCIQAEAMQKSIQLKPYFFHYFDLRKEFQKLYKRPATSIKDMLECILLPSLITLMYCIVSLLNLNAVLETLQLLTFFIRAYLYVYVCVGVWDHWGKGLGLYGLSLLNFPSQEWCW